MILRVRQATDQSVELICEIHGRFFALYFNNYSPIPHLIFFVFCIFQGDKIVNAIPKRRLGDPKELEGLLLLMASENASSYMTGSVVSLDGGIALSNL